MGFGRQSIIFNWLHEALNKICLDCHWLLDLSHSLCIMGQEPLSSSVKLPSLHHVFFNDHY